jgi:hypothetical protein
MNLAKILENADNFFGVMIFGNVGVCLVIISVFLLNIGNLGTMPVPIVISLSILIFGNFFGINFICIYANDKVNCMDAQIFYPSCFNYLLRFCYAFLVSPVEL